MSVKNGGSTFGKSDPGAAVLKGAFVCRTRRLICLTTSPLSLGRREGTLKFESPLLHEGVWGRPGGGLGEART